MANLTRSNIPPLTRGTSQGYPVKRAVLRNSASGFVFKIPDRKILDRFLILGTDNGSFYSSGKELTSLNMSVISRLIRDDGDYTLNRIIEISESGRAKDNDYALLAYALLMTEGSPELKKRARKEFPRVARIGTHLYHFVRFAKHFRGWGSSLKKTVSDWITNRSLDNLAFQYLKYRQRDGWGMRDLLRLTHISPKTADSCALYKYITTGAAEVSDRLPAQVLAVESVKQEVTSGNPDMGRVIDLIRNHRLSMEMIPNNLHNDVKVAKVIIPNLGLTALIRNLKRFILMGGKPGILDSEGPEWGLISSKLLNVDELRSAKVHPLSLLLAMKTLRAELGESSIEHILCALEQAFYLSFSAVSSTGRRRLLALDVSQSMTSHSISLTPLISCAEASAVMAMLALRSEASVEIMGFSTGFIKLDLAADMTLAQVLEKIRNLSFSATDCSLPMKYAASEGMLVDSFEVYTDNETYYGVDMHPFEALKAYRAASGITDAKLSVIAMTATDYSIADPSDANMADFVGLDSHTPALISQFIMGDL